MKVKTLPCRNCGDPLDPRRVELGYDYCLKDECQRRCMRRTQVASVGVNKAADYFATPEELLPPPFVPPARPAGAQDEPEADAVAPRRPKSAPPRRVKSTLEKLQEVERALDEALDAAYQRFCRNEITAGQLREQRERLIGAFNQVVMSENIRYRGMLRK